MLQSELLREGEHMLTVCNACRYCEGFCAVWPAMEYRRKFSESDLTYLANLCHNCTECYFACQYAPPHEWLVNPPQTFAKLARNLMSNSRGRSGWAAPSAPMRWWCPWCRLWCWSFSCWGLPRCWDPTLWSQPFREATSIRSLPMKFWF